MLLCCSPAFKHGCAFVKSLESCNFLHFLSESCIIRIASNWSISFDMMSWILGPITRQIQISYTRSQILSIFSVNQLLKKYLVQLSHLTPGELGTPEEKAAKTRSHRNGLAICWFFVVMDNCIQVCLLHHLTFYLFVWNVISPPSHLQIEANSYFLGSAWIPSG